MKTKKLILAAGLGAALALAVPQLRADEAKGGAGEQMGGPMGKMEEKLGLSEDQAKRMKDAKKANHDAMQPLMEKAKLDVDSLRVLVDKKASDDELKAQIAKLKQDRQAIDEARQKDMDSMAAILTPTQQAKAAIAMAERMEHMGGMGMEGHKGRHHDGMGKDDEKGGDKPADHAPDSATDSK